MAEVEADLSRSKLLREKQAEEFSWQLDEIKKKFEQQVSCFAPPGRGEEGHPFLQL